MDLRLWFDEHRYAAWTIDGELVTVEDPSPKRGIGSARVHPVPQEEIRTILTVDRLIPTVIAFYKGDSLDEQGSVSRYLPHFDLLKALHAALQRALEAEEKQRAEMEAQEPPKAVSSPTPRVKPLKKSRFRPDGNFIVYQTPAPEDDLPEFAIKLLPCVPEAFPDRRNAQRFIDKHTRRGNVPEGCRIARVLAAVRARPMFRKGIDVPKEPEQIIELIRREPRIVEPDLHLEWLPRFVQRDDGDWHQKPFKNRRTVRHALRPILLDELRLATSRAVRCVEVQNMKNGLGVRDPGVLQMDQLEPLKLALRAQRSLPRSWQEKLGLYDCGLGPSWSDLMERSHCPPATEEGHWVRAPFEVGKPHMDGLRSRLVELRIDDLPGLLEGFGIEAEFWMIKDRPERTARWVLAAQIIL